MSYFKQPIKANVFTKYNEKASHKLFFFRCNTIKHFALQSYQEKDQLDLHHLEPHGVNFNFQP